MINNHNQKQLGEERIYFTSTSRSQSITEENREELKQEQRQDPQRKAAYWPALVLKGSSSTSFYFSIQSRPTPTGMAPPTGILSERLALPSSTNITDNAPQTDPLASLI